MSPYDLKVWLKLGYAEEYERGKFRIVSMNKTTGKLETTDIKYVGKLKDLK